MFGVSITELVVIFAVALLAFGPRKLPEIASGLGRLAAELRKASDSFRREFYNSVYTPAQEEGRNVARSLGAIKRDAEAFLETPQVNSSSTAPSAPGEQKNE